MTPFIASGAQRWDCAAAESAGSAEVGALAPGSFLFFMGEKSHSEHRFFPLSIKRLSTIKQGEEKGTLRLHGFPAWSWEVGGRGAAGAVAKPRWAGGGQLGTPGGWRAWEDSKAREIRLAS